MKPKIGFVVPGGVSTPEMREKALAQLSTLNMDVRAIEGFPARKADILQAADRLRKEDVDGFILYQPGISSEEAGCLLASELRDYPMLLWARWGSPSEGFYLPLAGLFSQASNIKRLGKDFFHLLGEPEEASTKGVLMAFAKAAMTARRLRRASIGIVGLSNRNMLDTTFSAFHIRKIVPHILNLDTYELVKLYEKVDEDAANRVAEDLKHKVGRIEVGEERLRDVAKAYLAIKSMVEKYGLDAVTIREFPELGKSRITICVGCALLSDEGTACLNECDIGSTITSLALYYLTGKQSFVGEAAFGDPVKNTILIYHEGVAAFSLAERKEDIAITRAGIDFEIRAGKRDGVPVQFPVRPGRVTVTRLSGRPIEDRLRMIMTKGEVIPLPTPPTGGACVANVRFDAPLKDVVNSWTDYGFEHHHLLVHDDVVAELSYLCDIIGVQKIVV
jgi:L-fucose isomerase-like protein